MVVIPIEHKMPSPHMAAPTNTMVREAFEEGIIQMNEAERLGPEEEI